jgi:hypothetical protein
MKEAQINKNRSKVREISERLWFTNVPSPSDVLLANPLQPLLSTLFDLFRASQTRSQEQSLSVRKQVTFNRKEYRPTIFIMIVRPSLLFPFDQRF